MHDLLDDVLKKSRLSNLFFSNFIYINVNCLSNSQNCLILRTVVTFVSDQKQKDIFSSSDSGSDHSSGSASNMECKALHFKTIFRRTTFILIILVSFLKSFVNLFICHELLSFLFYFFLSFHLKVFNLIYYKHTPLQFTQANV